MTSSLYQRAIRLLSLRDHSVAELRQKLLRGKFQGPTLKGGALATGSRQRREGSDPDIVDQVIEKLISQGLLDDARFAQNFLRYQLERRPQGPALLTAKLRAKGLSSDLIQTSLRSLLTDSKQLASLARSALASQASLFRLPRAQYRARAFGFLSRRGFPPQIILPLIDSLAPKE